MLVKSETKKVTWTMSLSIISEDIANNYLRLDFPKGYSNGLLDYSALRSKGVDPKCVHRPIHGHINACRVSVLIPLLFALYKKYIYELPPKLQDEIKKATPETIKKIQIVAMMRATGRTEDGDSGIKFAQQGKKECLHYLEQIGIDDPVEREELSSVIGCDGPKNKDLLLAACLLGDATTMETFRDGLSYDAKNIYLDYFAFYNMLALPKKLSAANEFIAFCTAHAGVIKRHQGYIFSALKLRNNYRIRNDWPLDDYSKSKELKDGKLNQIIELEHSDLCYQRCEQDVHRVLKRPFNSEVQFA